MLYQHPYLFIRIGFMRCSINTRRCSQAGHDTMKAIIKSGKPTQPTKGSFKTTCAGAM